MLSYPRKTALQNVL